MKVVMLMFDSLNRHMLPPYNRKTWVQAPNFARLAERAVTFERSYVCSMPCMPARRDLHTGRPNFLHCGWGPIEPFDDSVPQMLSDAGVYTHLASDHYHYWEDGGATYHNRYNSWEFFRGQEGDAFIGQVAEPTIPPNINVNQRRADWVNRQHIQRDEDYPQSRTFEAGLTFIERNHAEDRWFLQIECFDPHEPFTCHRQWRDRYGQEEVDAPLFDWPAYREVTETPGQVEQARRRYAALVSKCDASLGDVLDAMDRHAMWDDTMLIVWTDHGFMLGEHNCWAKSWMPLYEEISHTPFFVWDPRSGCRGERRGALVQPAIDLGPTLLDVFGLDPTPHMLGQNLRPVLENDAPVREAAIFGFHNNRVNVTDGRYVYLREAVGAEPAWHYTLSPTAMRRWKPNLTEATLAPPLSFSKAMPTLRIPAPPRQVPTSPNHLLFDLEADPAQQQPLVQTEIEQRMIDHMAHLMQQCDAPPEQYARMGLDVLTPQITSV